MPARENPAPPPASGLPIRPVFMSQSQSATYSPEVIEWPAGMIRDSMENLQGLISAQVPDDLCDLSNQVKQDVPTVINLRNELMRQAEKFQENFPGAERELLNMARNTVQEAHRWERKVKANYNAQGGSSNSVDKKYIDLDLNRVTLIFK